MNFSDNSFDAFDMTDFNDNIDEFLRDSDGNLESASSSFSDSYDVMFPVYRSLDVLVADFSSDIGIDKVFEPPTLLRTSTTKNSSTSFPSFLDNNESSDLFDMLEKDFLSTGLPSINSSLCGIAMTSFSVTASIESVTTQILNFLKLSHVYYEYFSECSLFKCESRNLTDSCKYNIQLYSTDVPTEFTIEFCRMAGCGLLFSSHFRLFKSEQSLTEQDLRPVEDTNISNIPLVSPIDLTSTQKSIDAIINWANHDLVEATRAVCSMLCMKTSLCLPVTTGDLNSIDIMIFTLVGCLCIKWKEQQSAADSALDYLPVLSLFDILLQARSKLEVTNLQSPKYVLLTTMIDALIPTTVRLSLLSSPLSPVSEMIRDSANSLMAVLVK